MQLVHLFATSFETPPPLLLVKKLLIILRDFAVLQIILV